MNRLSLKFLSLRLEEEYQSVKTNFMMKKFYLFYKLQMAFAAVMFFVILITKNFQMQDVFKLIGFLVLVIVLYLLKKLMKNFFYYIIILIFSGSGFFFVEIIKTVSQGNNSYNVEAVSLILPFGFYLGLMLLSHASWVFCSSLYCINIIYLYLRIFDIYLINELIIPTFGCIIIMISFSLISYLQEKTNREYFKQLHGSYENLKQFRMVMQSLLPSSIFILNYEDEKIEFSNKSASKLLRRQKNMISEIFDENRKFTSLNFLHLDMTGSKSSSFNDLSLTKLEEILDSFEIMTENNDPFRKNLLLSEIMHKFMINNKTDINLNLERTNEFLTIHVIGQIHKKDNVEETPEINIIDSKTSHHVSFSKKRYYEVKLAKITWDDKPCLLAIFNDNTNSKRLIEMINLDKYKNQMLASISHDLRTPLNSVMGMMTTVMESINDRESKKNLLIALRSANLLNFLINDILDFSQINYKKLRLNVENINLVELISEIFTLMKKQAKLKNLEFRWEIKSIEEENLYSDSNRIKQILLNLLNNSIKFTKTGHITLKAEKIIENNSRIFKFSVEDSGIGIHEEDLDKLFVLFGRLNQETPDINKTGIGLGLTISNTLAKMLYNGKDNGIHVESQWGKGSTFWFKIDGGNVELENFHFIEEKKYNENNEKICNKLKKYDSSHSLGSEKFFAITGKSFCSYSSSNTLVQNDSFCSIKPILIVDDDPLNIMILEKYLNFFKLEHLNAMNGLEALELIENNVIVKNKEISMILMDVNMPIMNGFKATENIITLLKKNQKKEIPIVAVTANVTNADLDLSLKSGMKKFLSKPVRRKDLGLVLQSILKIKLSIE